MLSIVIKHPVPASSENYLTVPAYENLSTGRAVKAGSPMVYVVPQFELLDVVK